MADKGSGFEKEQYSSCDFNELVSTMEPSFFAGDISAYLAPCEALPDIEPGLEHDPCNNVDEPNIFSTEALVDPFNSFVLTESSDLRDPCGEDIGNKVNDGRRSSSRRSTRKSSSKQKSDTKVAERKSRSSGKKPVVDLLSADIGRGQRSNMARSMRPTAWGFVGKIDEIFKQNAENTMDALGRMADRGGKRNTDPVSIFSKSIQSSESESKAVNKGLLVKLKLGPIVIQNCQVNTIPDMEKDLDSYRDVNLEASNLQNGAKESFEKEGFRDSDENLDKVTASLKLPVTDVPIAQRDPGTSPDSEVINVIPDTQVNGNVTEEIRASSKVCVSHQSDDSGVASGIPSPEIVNDTLLCEKQIVGSFHQTDVRVSMDMLTVESVMKADLTIAGIESMESRSNSQHVQKSPKSKSSKNRFNDNQKASPAKSTAKGSIKERTDTETHPVTEMNDGLEEGSRSTVMPLSNTPIVPQSAWVCCDDCHKWRRISTVLADAIESKECRWICKDNLDKAFADCSIPQEMSNADINEELELSEASGEEDACNNTRLNSSQLTKKQSSDPPQHSWKLIKTNMFLHRNRKNQPIDEVMVCHCKPPTDGRMGCRDECLNRMLNIECVKGTCPCGEFCSNQQFQKRKYSKLKCFPTGKKGHGLQLQEDIPKGRFLIEYVGEVLDMHAYEARQKEYASKGHKHFYFMTLNGSEVIDACAKGNLGRFINHSCEPNCRTEKWMVNGEVCIGLFALRDIQKGGELTFDYNYVRVFGAAAKKCVCGSSRCRGVIGGDPLNDETVVLGDSDDEYIEPVTFYENINNKLDDIIPVTVNPESSFVNDVENNQSSESLGEKNDDHAILINSATSAPECKTEHTEGLFSSSVQLQVQPLDASFTVKSEMKIQNVNTASVNLVPEDDELRKKPKSHKNDKCTILKPKSRSKVHSSSSTVKKGKSKSKHTEIDTKPPVVPQKPKKIVVDNLTGRFEAVEEALNTLLSKGGISKRRDAWKGYLTLLCLTANGGNGEGIQSNRDLSMILDALLRTKSRTVLLDIINKNGLQMLHILLKRYRKVFNKTPILRKLLKVLEYLAETKILTLDNILKSSLPGVESFKESILSLTEHADKEVHQIARNFRDRYIPWSARRVNRVERDIDRMEFQQNSNFKTKTFPMQQKRPSEVADNLIKQSVTTVEAPSASCVSSSCTDRTRTRKRKSRWDQPGDVASDTQFPSKRSNTGQQQTDRQDMDVDAPPGFSPPSAVMGQPQDRYIARLPVAFGLPTSILKNLGEGGPAESWVVAPAMTFHSFPPLPLYPRSESRPAKEEDSWHSCNFPRDRNPNTLGRRYFRQQKWNHPRPGGGRQWNKYGPTGFNGPACFNGPAGFSGPNQNQANFGVGCDAGNGYHHYHQQYQPHQ
ncbi:histone-lysine N-methyltransferase ASHH2-like [Bidens hawaiensis]|uniref:histone-lysine N-methyltransferase ASHH2-like n=1 Tax=Bidens hawaiensis TaxID=980011 RepID=UPI00404B18B3